MELSQDYLAKELGENWQDEYVIWDCCAGTGNMEAGLTNKYNIWASTIDKADVDVMHTRIKMMNEKANGAANLLDEHVFQFDFLNDSFDKLPKGLKAIVDDPEKRKKLVVYINPPYAEHGNRRVIVGEGEHKTNVARGTKAHEEFVGIVGTATRELYIQFFLQIYSRIPGCVLGSFSTLKYVCSQNCRLFRNYWGATFKRGFVCPSNTFDNVKGAFPIGFLIWRIAETHERACPAESVVVDVIEGDSHYVGQKRFYSCNGVEMISDWLRGFYDKGNGSKIGFIALPGVSMQQQGGVYFTSKPTASDVKAHKVAAITKNNVIPMAVYLSVRHCIGAEWINNKDEFLFPRDSWSKDYEFCGDCMVYALFSQANNIKSEHGSNHWIPFTEEDVDAQDNFASRFMSDFLSGKIDAGSADLFGAAKCAALVISAEARAVLDAGRELWRYYHAQPKANPNASYYDIRKFFQGVKVDAKGKEKMNATSGDLWYNEFLAALKQAMKKLAAKIQPKVYEYGFLKR